MQKILKKILIILGAYLLISAFTGEITPVTKAATDNTPAIETLPSSSLRMQYPLKPAIVSTDRKSVTQFLGGLVAFAKNNLVNCSSCHVQLITEPTPTLIDSPDMMPTLGADALSRNIATHGGGSMDCVGCHGSPHVIYPTITAGENEQSTHLRNHSGPIVECAACHTEAPDDAFWHFGGDD